MKSIQITKTGAYFPEIMLENEKLEQKLQLEPGYIQKRTGIKTRYYTNETQQEMARKLMQKMFANQEEVNGIGLIIACTTTPTQFMPGISNFIQQILKIPNCICFDILAGCAGFINAMDIAQKYLTTSSIQKALIVGIEQLSNFFDKKDVSTAIILADGAGGIVLEQTKEHKRYASKIEANIDTKQILSTSIDLKRNLHLEMKGRDIYKYAVTATVENIQKLLQETGETLNNIKYIVPHQSNLRIIKSIASRLGKQETKKIYTNIQNAGNTYCASIPIALHEMFQKGVIETGDKIILLGYGGGLNTGSILLEL